MARLWTTTANATFVEGMVRCQRDGLQAESGWKPQMWHQVSTCMQSKGFNISSKQCKTQWNKLKGDFKVFKALKEKSGFGYNAVTFTVTATATVWNAYLATHSQASKFRKKGFPVFNKMAALCDGTIATGELVISAGGVPTAQDGSQDSQLSLPDTQPSTGDAEPSSFDTGAQDEDKSDEEEEDDVLPISTRNAAPARPLKRARGCQTSAATLDKLVECVGSLVEGLATPVSDTPACKRRAIEIICEDEGLSPHSFSMVPRIFRGSGDVAQEYLSFAPDEYEARSIWLQGELDEVQKHMNRM